MPTSANDRRDKKTRAAVEFIFGYWQVICKHPRAILDPKRAQKIEARLKENKGDVEELLYVIDGTAGTPFRNGTHAKSEGQKWDDVMYIMADRSRVEQLAETIPEYRKHLRHEAMGQWEEVLAGIETPLLVEPKAMRIVS